MRRLLRRPNWIWGAIALAALGCASEPEPAEHDRARRDEDQQALGAFVVNYPLQYFTERIGGDQVEVTFPAPTDGDPAYWRPDAETIAAYQGANLILLNGADYAKWVGLVSLPRAKLVDTSASFRDRYVPLDAGPVHTHGPEGEHSHTGFAFTTWLDLSLAIEHGRAIVEALSAARPEKAQAFETGFAALEADLSQLARRLEEVAESLVGESVVFSHPVYQYLEARYGIEGHSVHWEPDAEPDEELWAELEVYLAEHPAKWMIWEDEPLSGTRARLAEMGVGCLVLRPLANAPRSGDFLSEMTADLAAIEATLAAY